MTVEVDDNIDNDRSVAVEIPDSYLVTIESPDENVALFDHVRANFGKLMEKIQKKSL